MSAGHVAPKSLYYMVFLALIVGTILTYAVALVGLVSAKNPAISAAADQLYTRLTRAGFEVLYDDRDERAGVKFNDADLLGIPLRLTVGGKGLQNGVVEFKLRRTGATGSIPLDQLEEGVRSLLAEEWQAIGEAPDTK